MPIGTFALPNVQHMNSFFRSFFAALLALVVFSAIGFLFMIVVLAVLSSGQKVETGKNAVLIVDLSKHYFEVPPSQPFARLTGQQETPSLYHLNRMIRHAADDGSVKGIFLKCESNANNFAASEAIRDALLEFRKSGKFVLASANLIPQNAYYVATGADKIYCSPTGGVDWHGFSITMPFIKGTLERLEIEPQIFYAGKFKSATEPFRETEMTDANRLQNAELLNDVYSHFLYQVGEARNIDTASLRAFADSNALQFAPAALKLKMVDGLLYDDQVKDEMRKRLQVDKDDKINFVTLEKYHEAVDVMPSGKDRIAVIYAEGTIVDGKGDRESIGGDTYRNLIRKARMDESTKAIVLRINSGGGSASASEQMWREVVLAKKVKPVIVSFGDVAASGGYYMACGADSIFAAANTITGSIGVFGLLPNMKNFFNNKLGVTFDEVKTSPDAGYLTITRPLTPRQRMYFQQSIDTIYHDFKRKVADGRNRSMEYVDSVAQGRVWSGKRALALGLVDRLGSLDDAIAAAAAKAKVTDYRLREYPDRPGLLEMLQGETDSYKEIAVEKELGSEAYQALTTLRNLRQLIGTPQARMPFDLVIE